MRRETHRISVHIIRLLQASGTVGAILHDGGDIITLRLVSGETVSIHLIESAISLHELRLTLAANNAASIHTVFILWCAMLLPAEGRQTVEDDWLAALLALYGDKVYAYEVFSATDMAVFPIYFDGVYAERTVRYGDEINVVRLTCQSVTTFGVLDGEWRAAGFEAAPRRTPPRPAPLTRTQLYYDVLGLHEGAGQLAIKMAYRRLARQYHPDLNRAADANARMQQINEAYAALMALFEDGAL